ncbi:MAG: enoyl-CoA hydratase [Alphaproteobacteria bacterium]
MHYETILTEVRGHVGLLTLNRPKALNALSSTLVQEMGDALTQWDKDDAVRAIVITGSEKAFAAGADIKEMASKNFSDVYAEDFITAEWETIRSIRKPVIAAVAGYALGGGCELAMMCDIILAAENAKFGQPEITIGTIPGAGGTQRLTRYIGKSKAMEMCLTGRTMSAEEAERSNLVARVVPPADLIDEALKLGERIASMSLPIVMMAKETVNAAYETTLNEGIMRERRMFHATFATKDPNEGMAAFAEKRQPDFKDK